MHSMWKGAISFGLVMIPVRLYAATEQRDISFRQVHRVDGGRIRFRRVCSVCGEEVAYEDVAKGYELPTGEMVILTEEDMADLPLPTTRSIEVLHFAPAEQLDPILFNRSYYVEPEAAGARAYVLLRTALEQSGRVAVAQVALRQRESLATLRTMDGVIVLETLLWPDEVRPAQFPFLEDDIEVRQPELAMAASLIDSMTLDFDPDAHRDGYREALIELVSAKTEGRELLQPGTLEIAAGEPVSLTEALQASLEAARGSAARSRNGGPRGKAKAVGDKPAARKAIGSAKPGSSKSPGPGGGSRGAASSAAGRSAAASSRTGRSKAAAASKAGSSKTAGDAKPAGRPARPASARPKTAKPKG